ncbi:magnesium/cobalt transporter CorA [Candidatus Hydrogenedentota bacterium]
MLDIKRHLRRGGLPPGSLEIPGKAAEAPSPTKIERFDYDEATCHESECPTFEESLIAPVQGRKSWINVNGIHDTSILKAVGETLSVHPLILEDIMHPVQRPKIEDEGDCIFVVAPMLTFDKSENVLKSEQVSFLLFADRVLTFQERPGDVFDPVRNRLRTGKGLVRKSGTDYLMYALLDVMVDNYFSVIENMGNELENIEELIMANPDPSIQANLYKLKRETVYLRKCVWPLREMVSEMERSDNALISDSTRKYLRDLQDHAIQVLDVVEQYRDILTSLLDLYLSSVSTRMNNVMKVLTIFATIFMPITFVAGIYGMNFKYMPELEWRFGYFMVIVVMIGVVGGMLVYFRRKRWL